MFDRIRAAASVLIQGNPQAVLDRQAPVMLGGKPRSPHWPSFRDHFLQGKVCVGCGRKDHLNAHHIKPYHVFPELELVESNLIPLCEAVTACHFVCGHGSVAWTVNTPDPWGAAHQLSVFLNNLKRNAK